MSDDDTVKDNDVTNEESGNHSSVSGSSEPVENQALSEMMSEIEQAQEAANTVSRKRLRAIVDTYWSLSDSGSPEFDLLKTHLNDLFGISSPTRTHLKTLLDSFPERIIGIIIAWGFNDSIVAEDIFEFLDRNQIELMSQLHPH